MEIAKIQHHSTYPQVLEMEGAVKALQRLQEVYGLEISDLVSGQIGEEQTK